MRDNAEEGTQLTAAVACVSRKAWHFPMPSDLNLRVVLLLSKLAISMFVGPSILHGMKARSPMETVVLMVDNQGTLTYGSVLSKLLSNVSNS